MSITIVFLLLFISSCGLLDGKTKEEKIDEYFRAELNGKAVEFDDQLAIKGSRSPDWLGVSGFKPDSMRYPYVLKISFSHNYVETRTEYNVVRDSTDFSGASFTELDGDVIIARYNVIEDENNRLEILSDTLDSGKVVLVGSFAMKVVVYGGNNQYRQYPDTVVVTNGTFRIVLQQFDDLNK